MNPDFELELESANYMRVPTIALRVRRLTAAVLWLASPGDTLIVDVDDQSLREAAGRLGIELVGLSPSDSVGLSPFIFTPWGWSRQARDLGQRLGARVESPDPDVVARVNSKLFSHQLERDLEIAMAGAGVARDLAELETLLKSACPHSQDKWVIKSPFGFSARGRVLGRGPSLDPASRKWAERRFERGDALLMEPWLDVLREYGVQLMIDRGGRVDLLGITDIQTNGAGAVTGYLFGRRPDPARAHQLAETALEVGRRLWTEGYWGPANVDALEHRGGLRPLLEINARYTLGHVALEVERSLDPSSEIFWELKEGAFPLPRA
jgi:hypothetical protein